MAELVSDQSGGQACFVEHRGRRLPEAVRGHDSFGPEPQADTNGLGFLPYGNGVHYDREDRRRPPVHRLVANGTLGTTHCTDDAVGMLYRATDFAEAVSEQAGKRAYIVRREGDHAVEEQFQTFPLGQRPGQTPANSKSVTWRP